jgi:uncharacterized protein (DUF2164 family)
MKKTLRQWDRLNQQERTASISKIQYFFQQEHDLQMGIIAAEEVLDFFLEGVSLPIYKKGIADAQAIMQQSHDDLSVDLSLMAEA